jgi:uncharacterized RDD family membrane protein YckC
MMTGLMTTGLTNRPSGGDSAVPSHLYATDAVELAPGSAAEIVYPNSDSWRVEVAARLERYRTRRKPRTPRYPSLLLPFDAPESWSRPAPPGASAAVAAAPARAAQNLLNEEPTAGAATAVAEPSQTSERHPSEHGPNPYPELALEQAAKVIEFPRSAAIPVFRASELADPIFDRPRIVEAPEVLPPPPALGGMLIEAADKEPADKPSGADFPFVSPSASVVRRALAALVDGVVVATALAAFAAIFLRLNPSLNPSLYSVRGALPMLAGPTFARSTFAGPMLAGSTFAAALAVVAILLWTAYEFLFVVYTGSTPGLRAAGLRLAAFDGSPLSRRLRRWRVLASFLSAFSAGLGYLWCVLDQHGLCWHDRITRTHVQSVAQTELNC